MIYTVGHSNHPIERFIALLNAPADAPTAPPPTPSPTPHTVNARRKRDVAQVQADLERMGL